MKLHKYSWLVDEGITHEKGQPIEQWVAHFRIRKWHPGFWWFVITCTIENWWHKWHSQL